MHSCVFQKYLFPSGVCASPVPPSQEMSPAWSLAVGRLRGRGMPTPAAVTSMAWRGRPAHRHRRSTGRAEPGRHCPIPPLGRDRLGLLPAKQAELDGTPGSGRPGAESGPGDISEGWTCCCFWLSVGAWRAKYSLSRGCKSVLTHSNFCS